MKFCFPISLSLFRRLTLLGVVAVVAGLAPVVATATCSDVTAALAGGSCHNSGGFVRECDTKPAANGNPNQTDVWSHSHPASGAGSGTISDTLIGRYTCNRCAEIAQPIFDVKSDGSSACIDGCTYEPQEGGNTDTVRSGNWLSQLKTQTYAPSGKLCLPGLPPLITKPPKVCGGASCNDIPGQQYCALDGAGNRVCVPYPTPQKPGGCISSGDTTLCAGKPPPLPPNPPVADPNTDIAGTDEYGHQNGNGPINLTIVNNYNNSGNQPNNGANPGDVGDSPGATKPKPGSGNDPASSSSTGNAGDGTTASGGGDCNTPPIVGGSPAAQAIAYQAWKTRCAVEKGGNGNLGTGTVGTLGDLYKPTGDTVDSAVTDFQASIKDAPIGAAVTGFFTVENTGGSCPTWSMPESDWLPAQTFDFYCRPDLDFVLDGARIVILIAFAFAAFRIGFGEA